MGQPELDRLKPDHDRPSSLRVFWTILGLKIRRRYNQILAGVGQLAGSTSKESERTGTSRGGMGCLAVIAVLVLIQVPFWFQIPIDVVERIEKDIARPVEFTESFWMDKPPPSVDASKQKWYDMNPAERRLLIEAEWLNSRLETIHFVMYKARVHLPSLESPVFLGTVSSLLSIMALAILFAMNGINQRAVGELDFDVRHMLSFPLTPMEVYFSTIIERTVTTVFGWALFFPAYTVILWFWGWGWWSLAWALPLTLMTTFLIALLSICMEVLWLRLFTSYQLRTLRAVSTILSIFLLFSTFLLFRPEGGAVTSFLLDFCEKFGVVAVWLPMGRAIRLFQPGGFRMLPGLLFVGELILAIGLTRYFINWLGSRSLESVKGARSGSTRGETPERLTSDFWSSTIGKDLKLLFRSKNILVQVTVIPILLAVFNLLMNREILFSMLRDPTQWGAVSFGLGLYTLVMAAPNVLLHEKDGLWLLFTFPRELDRAFFQKIALWTGLGGVYGGLCWLVGIAFRSGIRPGDLWSLAWIVVGLPVFGMIAGGIGVMTTDPQATDQRNRVGMDVIYFIMILGGGLLSGLFISSAWQKLALMVLYTALAMALYQKLHETISHVLDPSAFQDRKADLADGMILALGYFLFQFLTISIFYVYGRLSHLALLVSFAVAGVLSLITVGTVLTMRNVKFWERLRRQPLPGWLNWSKQVFGTAALVVGFGLIYLWGIQQLGVNEGYVGDIESRVWIMVGFLAVFLAPVFEEIIFRGYIFGGMRTTLSFTLAALSSSLIFAVIHPARSAIPVFVTGFGAAYVYEKHQNIISPIAVHGVYNLSVFLFQWYYLQQINLF